MRKRRLAGLFGALVGAVVVLGGACQKEVGAPPPPHEPCAPCDPAAPRSPAHAPHGIRIIDSHVHIVPTMPALAQALEVFDRSGVAKFVVKSAGVPGEPRYAATLAMKRVLGERMEWFSNVDWDGIDRPDFAARTAAAFERAARDGAKGVKIFKALGLSVRTADGRLVPVDDPRLDPLFETAGALGFLVALHIGDPVAFFEPPTPDNERYDELSIAKGWSFHGQDYPSHAELMAQQERRVARHPKTIFLLIHLAGYSENLDYVDKLLDSHPNVWVDVSARVPEIGRHPADKARAFFLKHQDRILFGSDFISSPGGMQLGSVWHVPNEDPGIDDAVEFFRRHWQYFETDGRQIEHPTPIQGRWKVDAIQLPEEVLRKFYHDNAEWLLFTPLRPIEERAKDQQAPATLKKTYGGS
jgi:predicted TIM-barrel fold metal-dependent hydrolase